MIGEDPNGTPNNLMPFVSQVCIGRRPHVSVFGNDYATPDGTGVRDYIHVMDLAEGHVSALRFLERSAPQPAAEKPPQVVEEEEALSSSSTGRGKYSVFNLGTGIGVSVLEMIQAMQAASKVDIKYVIAPRREGDIATCYADASKAKLVLGWEGTYIWRYACV